MSAAKGSMTKIQQENVQNTFLAFHAKHLEDTSVISGREFPMTLIFCKVCDWTEEIRTNSGMNIGRRLASKRHFAFVQSKRKMRNKVCPLCKEPKGIRKIIWGMPAGPLDESKYVTGGCCVSPDGNDSRGTCIKCGWEN